MERRNRNMLGLAVSLATLGVGAGGEVLPPAPPAKDEKPRRRQSSGAIGYGIPFPGLKSVSRASMNRPPSTPSGTNLARAEKRERRRARMRLRKRRGWR